MLYYLADKGYFTPIVQFVQLLLLLTYLRNYLHNFLLTYLRTYLRNFLLTYLRNFLLT